MIEINFIEKEMKVYKVVPGNHSYIISLDGKIKNSDNTECTLEITNNKVRIEMYGVEELLDLEWLGLFSHFEIDRRYFILNKYSDIYFNEVNKNISRTISSKTMAFRKPIVVGEYRVIPNFTRYAVSKKGIVLDLFTNEIIKNITYGEDSYPTTYIFNPDKNMFRTTVTHRLVALAWVKNEDSYNKPIVNHKDGIKSNLDKNNLEWVNHSENANHAFINNLRNDNFPCKIRNVFTKEIIEFPSIQRACFYMGLSQSIRFKSFCYKRKSKLIKSKFELKLLDDNSSWFYENEDTIVERNGRYNIIVQDNKIILDKFYNVSSFVNKYKIWNAGNNVRSIIEKANLLYPNLEILLIDNYNNEPVQALNISSNEIFESKTIKELSCLIKISKNTIRDALQRKQTNFSNGYAFRYKTDKEWVNNFTTKIGDSKCILITNQLSGEVLEFRSLRETAKYLEKDRSVIIRCLKQNALFRNWEFKEINNKL